MNNLVRAITKDGSAVATAIDSTEIVAKMEQYHQTSAVVTAGLGRLTTAASMMGAQLKGEKDTVTIRMKGNGETGSLVAVADSSGNVKSYVVNPIVEIPLNRYGKLDVSGAIGKEGVLQVTKDLGLKEPYTGQVSFASGEVAEDITKYFAQSEQVPTVCSLGVLVNPDLTVKAAGGFLVQLLPFADTKVIDVIEKNINSFEPISSLIDSGVSPEEICMRLLDGLEANILDSSKAEYKCDCSRQRVEKTLISLGREELENLAAENEETEVCCHFCNKKYKFTQEQIKELIK